MYPITRFAAFKYKSTVTEEEKKAAIQGLLDLYALKSEYVSDVQGEDLGKNNNEEGYSKGFDIVFSVKFRSVEDRDKFIPDADHIAYKMSVIPIVEDVMVYDFVNGEY
ncbi:hypothetical protein JAAARDRAFT_165633 [Jaapia argillacea MUCL 33604]|uniref:Stress-response A/B barrel domain-containing protein n=1 Tax=Jaapia argillacea MUCL 33604 TaxID=933084 RepID=A0A067P3K6_9AGAM|nr:hypothetical protein JAAARDRAFT_165633 [Jaapia argillacea MUCL 33604]